MLVSASQICHLHLLKKIINDAYSVTYSHAGEVVLG